jgi:hypothetical protein
MDFRARQVKFIYQLSDERSVTWVQLLIDARRTRGKGKVRVRADIPG